MMRSKMQWHFLVAAMAALAVAGPAQAGPMIAGWSFSQYVGDQLLDTDGDFAGEGTLAANFSNRIPGDGAGAAANPYGTMYLNGSHGSTAIDVDGSPPLFAPSQSLGSLSSNQNSPLAFGTPVGAIGFNGPCGGQDGQAFCEATNAMVASPTGGGPLRVVFQASLVPDGMLGQDWMVSFAGRTLTAGTSDVTIDFSTDGVTYTGATIRQLTAVDSVFSVDFSAVLGDTVASAYVRLAFQPVAGSLPLIDNVAISATPTVIPEPGTAFLLALGLMGLGATRRRHA